MRTDPQKPASFRRQLAVTVAASTAVILLASAIATAFLVSGWVKTSILTHMDHMVREFARRSVLVYLSHDEATARNTAETLRSLPSVHSVVFLDRDYRGLFDDPRRRSPNLIALEGWARQVISGKMTTTSISWSRSRRTPPARRSTPHRRPMSRRRRGSAMCM